MTLYFVWQEQSDNFRQHQLQFTYCEKLGGSLEKYCVSARQARQLGFFYFVVRDTVSRTPWCMGYECSLDISWSSVLRGTMILVLMMLADRTILRQLWAWGYNRPAKLRAKRMAKQIENARGHF